jgi:hypothetical protein
MLSIPVFAEKDIETSLGKMEGHTTYTIEFVQNGDTGKSELAFNIDTLIDVVEYTNTNPNRFYSFSLEVKSNHFFENSGLLIDRDWQNGKEIIYSETKTDLELLNLDFRLTSKSLADNYDMRVITGYEWQDYNFVGYGTEQIDYRSSPSEITIIRNNINTITYEANYNIPYLGISIGNKDNVKRSYNIVLGYSPSVVVCDQDTHILRDKVSKTKTNGFAYFVEGKAKYKARNNSYFNIEAEYLKIETSGTQTQYGYNQAGQPVSVSGIAAEIKSTQAVIKAGYNNKF